MAGVAIATASTVLFTPPSSATSLSALVPPPSPVPGPFSSTFLRLRRTNPSLTLRHAKFSGSFRDGAEEIFGANFGDEIMAEEEYESDDDEEDTESSISLLIRFVRSIFKKISKRARKATRSILPDVISPQLVCFAVDGVLILASLSILKAFLEVICTLGGTVFAVILLLRVVWSAVTFFQSTGTGFNQSGASYGNTQPVT